MNDTFIWNRRTKQKMRFGSGLNTMNYLNRFYISKTKKIKPKSNLNFLTNLIFKIIELSNFFLKKIWYLILIKLELNYTQNYFGCQPVLSLPNKTENQNNWTKTPNLNNRTETDQFFFKYSNPILYFELSFQINNGI